MKSLYVAALALVFSSTPWTIAQEVAPKTNNAKPAAKAPAKKRPASAGQKAEADIQAHNAALPGNGARVSLNLMDKAVKDKQTGPEQTFDGNVHSRCVVTNSPYAFRVELVDKLPLTEINFIMSDYAGEAAPREVEVTLSDGTVLKQTLEAMRPKKGEPLPRQTLKVGKDVSWFEVKVLKVDPGVGTGGKTVTYGGLGEIEAITTADLKSYMEVPDVNATMPAYVEGGTPRNDYSAVKVTMPTKIGLESHPRLFMSRSEIVKWREEIQKTERGKAAFKSVQDVAAGPLAAPVVMPDPKVPAQLKDRGDAAAKAHGILSRNAGRMAWAYQLTDNEAYAVKVREILVGYAKLYPNDYAEHKGVNGSDSSKVMAQRLSEAMWLLPLIQAYDMIYDAKCMSDVDRKLIENDLLRTAITFINSKREAAQEVKQRDAQNPNWRTEDPATGGKGVGNWVNFYNAAYVQAGIVLGDKNWIDVGAADTRLMIARGIGDDGMWKEGAIGYQFFARMALVACMEPLARQGIDVYSSNKSRVKNLFDAAYKYAYPDGTMPGINDSGRVRVGGDWQAMAYDFGWLRFNDPNYGAAVNGAPRQIFQSDAIYFPTVVYDTLPEQPMKGLDSVIFDGLGYGIMRGQDSGGPTFMLLKFGPASGPHDHPDKLNLILFADGDELCGEPQFFRYEDARHPGWTKPTLSHYSLSVDENSQMATAAKLVAFSDAGTVKVMRGQCTTAYPGVGLDRTVVQMPGYIVDVYRGWGKTSHTFDYPLCFRGELAALKGVDAASLKPMSETRPGYKLFMTQPPATVTGNWSGAWSRAAKAAVSATADEAKIPGNPANEVKVTVLGDGETKVFNGVGADDRQKTVLRRTGTSAVFAAVIDPFKESDAVKSVENIKVEGPVPGYGMKVTRTDGGTDLLIVRFDSQKDGKPADASTFPGGKTDALVAVVRMDATGKVVQSGMVGGTSLVSGSKTLSLQAAGIKWEK